MAEKKIMELKALMDAHQEDTTEPVPEPVVAVVPDPEPDTPDTATDPTPATPDTAEEPTQETSGGGEGKDSSESTPAPAKKSTPKKTTPKKTTPKKSTRTAATAKKQASPKRTPQARTAAPATTETDPDDFTTLSTLDGRPARLWDTSTGQAPPPGWAREALRRVARNSRDSTHDWAKGNPLLPEQIHQEVLQWILEEAMSTGTQYSVSQILESALEQIPDDVPGCEAMLEDLPEEYLAPNVIRPRGSRLRSDTISRLSLLPLQLRAAGMNRHAGRVHTVAVIRFLDDVRGTRSDLPEGQSGDPDPDTTG